MFPMVAFATATVLNLLSLAFERRSSKAHLCFLAAYISSCACLFEFLSWAKLVPIYVSAAGRPISLARYVMWLHATPAMLYALSMMSDFSAPRVGRVIAVDVIMIVTVIPGELVPGGC